MCVPCGPFHRTKYDYSIKRHQNDDYVIIQYEKLYYIEKVTRFAVSIFQSTTIEISCPILQRVLVILSFKSTELKKKKVLNRASVCTYGVLWIMEPMKITSCSISTT